MNYEKYYALLLLLGILYGNDYQFNFSTINANYNQNHWKYEHANTAITINNIEIDIMQWKIITSNRDDIEVKIENESWKPAGLLNEYIEIPDFLRISDIIQFRNTPIVYVQINPWRINNGLVEFLSYADINISVYSPKQPIDFYNPYTLNGTKSLINRESFYDTEYLIITGEQFLSAAQIIADMHTDSVETNYQLRTRVALMNEIGSNGYDIRSYLLNQINDNSNLKYLLLFGDENLIPPIYNDEYPSDDFYSTSLDNIFFGDPQLASGRIPVSSLNDAISIAEKIKQYSLNPADGLWKSKIALVADDFYKSCSYHTTEKSHTIYSNNIYNSLKDLLLVEPFYGIQYQLKQTNNGCEYPDLTNELIRSINNGVSLINYIGHGAPDSWSSEKILNKTRDLPKINVLDNKLAIWIAGTCSFGKYYGEDSFMEELLIKKNGAIAVIATTDVIGYTENSTYLNNLFGINNENHGINSILKNEDDSRLGDLFVNAKNGNFHKFHIFGDPALRLPFPKSSNELVIDPPTNIPLVKEGTINLTKDAKYSTLIIKENHKQITYSNSGDSIQFTIPGQTLYQMFSAESNICFRIPIDANQCDNCIIIQVYQNTNDSWNGELQTIENISIINFDSIYLDNKGPIIQTFQNGNLISEGSTVFTNTNINVTLNDSSGINLMETIGHGIQYKFNNDSRTNISGNEFIYIDCDSGYLNIPVPIDLKRGENLFYLEAWDGLNNKSSINVNFNILDNSTSNNLFLNKIFPIPNPFSNYTEFTMFVSNPPANITISIYSLIGNKVITLEPYLAEDTFISIPWNGRNTHNQKIANGAYLYHIEVEKNGNLIFQEINKLAKIE